jgi:hypothetical protein
MGRHRGKRRTTPGHFIAIPPPSFSHWGSTLIPEGRIVSLQPLTF